MKPYAGSFGPLRTSYWITWPKTGQKRKFLFNGDSIGRV